MYDLVSKTFIEEIKTLTIAHCFGLSLTLMVFNYLLNKFPVVVGLEL
jgi:hypothetical protein